MRTVIVPVVAWLCLLAVSQPLYAQSFSLPSTAQEYSAEERPWVWWFWLGNAVTEEVIDHHLETYYNAGYGGVNIIASYGVKGYEDRAITYRSEKWYDMVQYTVKKAAALNMGVDLALSSAWPFGGPQVAEEDGARYLKRIKAFRAGDGPVKENILEENEFIVSVMAYGNGGEIRDITPAVNGSGVLEYTFPSTCWLVEATIGGYTRQQVKRSSPGGEGWVVDHFSQEAMAGYLHDYNKDMKKIEGVRALFNDSYEVYGADYTSAFIGEFEKRRGYSPQPYFSLLQDKEESEIAERFRCDYRAVMADLIHENFLQQWTDWSNGYGLKTVQQAHGSPSNLIDMYAAADIPQCESFGPSCFDIPGVRTDEDTRRDAYKRPDILHLKFASSAGNLMGRKLVASETATWLTNHFRTALSQVKPEVDQLFVSGINHIHLISTTNTPPDAPYPGWVFYPAPDFGPHSALLNYMPDFSLYVARIQHLLQQSQPDNGILLYFPVYDYFSENRSDLGNLSMMDHVPTKWGNDKPFAVTARRLKEAGYQFDYVSDKILAGLTVEDQQVCSPGGVRYHTLVIPACRRIPVETLEKLIAIAEEGVRVIFDTSLPGDVPGLYRLTERLVLQTMQKKRLAGIKSVSVSSRPDSVLLAAGIGKTDLSRKGLEYIRKNYRGGKLYFIANLKNVFQQDSIELDDQYNEIVAFNPQSGNRRKLEVTTRNGRSSVLLRLLPGESVILFAGCDMKVKERAVLMKEEITLPGMKWQLAFEKDPADRQWILPGSNFKSWTELDNDLCYFQGTGVYSALFDLPEELGQASRIQLRFAEVRDMAEVILNGKSVGRIWSVPYLVEFDSRLLKKRGNRIEIKVTNMATNRLIGMDRQGVNWQECYLADPKRKVFNTADWELEPAGLVGPVYFSGDANER